MKPNSAAIEVSQDERAQPPFASYAQTVRMLMPLARTIAFHDDRGRSLWASDDVDEAELSMQVQLLIDRYIDDDPHERHLNDHSDLFQPVHVFPVRDVSGLLVGALAVRFDNLPPTAAYRNYATVQRMLAPLLEILRHGWQSSDAQAKEFGSARHFEKVKASLESLTEPSATPVAMPAKNVNALGESAKPERSTPTALPAVLRQVLVQATEATEASFGTIVLPGHPFSFNHRRSEDESDLTVSAAADAARTHMLRLMSARNEPVIINEHGASQSQFSSYKLLAWPIRVGVDAGPLLALLVLFRRRQEPIFVQGNLVAVRRVTEQIPESVLAELQRIQTTRTLALQYQSKPMTTSRVVQSAKPKPIKKADTKKSDEVAFILPDRLEDDDVEKVDETLPAIVGAPLPSLPERLRAALANDAFELHAQRMAPLHDYERPDRFEVLLRMPDKYGLQTPAAFMSAAEASGLLPSLDLWVIRHALNRVRLDNRLGRRPRELSINLSATSLLDESFLERILGEIRGSNIKRGQLGFEISESVAIHHAQELRALAEPLQAAGCRIALDNCRTGLEIFDLIPQGAISCIKIDGSVVRQLGVSPSANTLIESMVERATACGIELVAEHVESHLACSTVISMGVDYAQGYHLEAPAPLAKLFY